MSTTFERLHDRINMLRPDANKPDALLVAPLETPQDAVGLEDAMDAVRRAYAQGRKDQHRETAALFRGIMAL